jgi:hypothetical protein
MKPTYKYIFMVGAPGSKWSSVTKNIYFSPDIDHTDYSEERTYWHDAPGQLELMHTGAYFDPGMEFGEFFDKLNEHTKEQCEAEFDRPFSGEGVRIIKSHVFAHHIDFIKDMWPECPIIMCYRNDDECLGWWVKCGHFGITYPLYDKYYKNLREMGKIITKQNVDILAAERKYFVLEHMDIRDNLQLCDALGIAHPPEEYKQHYPTADVKVSLI